MVITKIAQELFVVLFLCGQPAYIIALDENGLIDGPANLITAPEEVIFRLADIAVNPDKITGKVILEDITGQMCV